MYYAPYFTFGGKNPSQGYANAAVASNIWVENNRLKVDKIIAGEFSNFSPPWPGLIISSAAIAGSTNRFKYEITKVLLTPTPDAAATNTITDPDVTDYKVVSATLTTSVTAYNLYEYKHTSSGFLGDGTPLADIPIGFALVAVKGVVTVSQMIDSAGNLIYVFERNNGFSGECGE